MSKIYTPNNLPVKCFRQNGDMLEHAHADHPDYKYPVEIKYVGEITDKIISDFKAMTGREPDKNEDPRDLYHETHGLIYTDGCVAITIYENSYAMWSCRDGKNMGGNMWNSADYKLDINNFK